MLRVVIDTNIWIRALLRGRATLPVLSAWQAGQFHLITSQPLLDEYENVWQRPRLRQMIDAEQARKLHRQMRAQTEVVELITAPPRCRDPKDHPVLATAIGGSRRNCDLMHPDLDRMHRGIIPRASFASTDLGSRSHAISIGAYLCPGYGDTSSHLNFDINTAGNSEVDADQYIYTCGDSDPESHSNASVVP